MADWAGTVDEPSDVCSDTTQKNSIGNELKLIPIEPRNMEDSDITPQKLGDSCSGIIQTNSLGKELQIKVSDPTKVEEVEPVAGELKDNYNEILQTDIVDRELYEDKSEQRKTEVVNSAVEKLNVLYGENKQVCVGKKLQMGESETRNTNGIDSSGEQTHLDYINKVQHSYISTDQFLVNRSETNIVENNLQIGNTNFNNNKINQSVDLSKCLSNDSINSNGSDGKISESDSFVSDSSSLKTNKSYYSQLGLTEKLQPWIMSHMKASINSPQMQSENSVIETLRLTSEMEHKERRIKTNYNIEEMATDSILESQHTGSVGNISIINQKPASEKVLQNVTDEEVDVLSSSIEDVPSKKRQNFFGKILDFFGGNTKEHSHNTSLSENQKICDNEQNSPDLSLSEVCSNFYSNTSQNMNESFTVSQCSSVSETQCSEEAASAVSRSCADNWNDANTKRSDLHNDSLNNTHTKTVESEDSTTLHNKLSEMVDFQQEHDISTKKLSSILNSSEIKCVSGNRNSVLQNQNIKTDESQSHDEYVDSCNNQNNDCDAEIEESEILESEFTHQSCNKVSSSNDDDNVTNESVSKLVENKCGEAVQTLSSSSGTKEEHMSKTDRLHNVFVKTCETEDIDLKLLPQLVKSDSLRPQVLWHQDAYFVWIHILLHDVQKYKLLWSAREIYFKTIHNDTVYSFKMLLYGPMDPELLSHCIKGFHVELKLVKAVRGYEWSRLLKTELIRPWIKPNIDAQAQFYTDDADDADYIKMYYPRPGFDRTAYDRLLHDSSDDTSGSDGEEIE